MLFRRRLLEILTAPPSRRYSSIMIERGDSPSRAEKQIPIFITAFLIFDIDPRLEVFFFPTGNTYSMINGKDPRLGILSMTV